MLFEQIEPSPLQILSDCDLQSVTIRKEDIEKSDPKKLLFRDEKVGTDVEIDEKCVGPSTLKVNVATKYEFQKLNATQIHRAINDPRLGEFLVRVYPLLKEEIENSDLFNKL